MPGHKNQRLGVKTGTYPPVLAPLAQKRDLRPTNFVDTGYALCYADYDGHLPWLKRGKAGGQEAVTQPVLVTGATGFLGRRVVHALLAHGKRVRALTHDPGREHLLRAKGVEVRYGDVTDVSTVRAAMDGVGSVVHLVAIIRERGKRTFEQVNCLGTSNICDAARDANVQCLVYLGAIGAENEPRLPYLRSKWRAEETVKTSGIPHVILRTSIQFGEGDEFINTLAGLVKAFPIIPMAGNGRARFQPIAVEEVAECITQALDREDLLGQVIEIGGPEHQTYDEIMDTIARTYRVRRFKAHLPISLMRKMVWLMERILPCPPVTLHQLDMLASDNIAQVETVEQVFGFNPRPLEGNIDYIRSVSRWDALRISLGFMPKHIRDH